MRLSSGAADRFGDSICSNQDLLSHTWRCFLGFECKIDLGGEDYPHNVRDDFCHRDNKSARRVKFDYNQLRFIVPQWV